MRVRARRGEIYAILRNASPQSERLIKASLLLSERSAEIATMLERLLNAYFAGTIDEQVPSATMATG